jgi:hypothetical protein
MTRPSFRSRARTSRYIPLCIYRKLTPLKTEISSANSDSDDDGRTFGNPLVTPCEPLAAGNRLSIRSARPLSPSFAPLSRSSPFSRGIRASQPSLFSPPPFASPPLSPPSLQGKHVYTGAVLREIRPLLDTWHYTCGWISTDRSRSLLSVWRHSVVSRLPSWPGV